MNSTVIEKQMKRPSAINLVGYFKEFTAQCAERSIEPNYNLFTLWYDANQGSIPTPTGDGRVCSSVVSEKFSNSLN